MSRRESTYALAPQAQGTHPHQDAGTQQAAWPVPLREQSADMGTSALLQHVVITYGIWGVGPSWSSPFCVWVGLVRCSRGVS